MLKEAFIDFDRFVRGLGVLFDASVGLLMAIYDVEFSIDGSRFEQKNHHVTFLWA